ALRAARRETRRPRASHPGAECFGRASARTGSAAGAARWAAAPAGCPREVPSSAPTRSVPVAHGAPALDRTALALGIHAPGLGGTAGPGGHALLRRQATGLDERRQ